MSNLKLTGLAIVVAAAFATGPGAAASKTEPPSASPSGGAPQRTGGSAELTAERLAVAIRDYRGPDPYDLLPTEGEEHDDDERAAPRLAAQPYEPPQVGASALESPQLLTSWKAMDMTGGTAGDATIAVSTTHVVVTNRTTLRIFDKAGTVLGTVPATSLFAPLGLSDVDFFPAPIDAYFDMRSLFDPFRKRIWVMALGINKTWRTREPKNKRHVTAVAVSKTENPLDGWYLYWWDSVPHWGEFNDAVYDPGDASDYPTIGIDAGLFHETHAVNNYPDSKSKTFKFWRVTFFGADAMAAGQPGANVQGWQYWDLQDPDGSTPNTIQAVVHHTANPLSFYVSRDPIDKQHPGHVAVVWALSKPFQAGQKIVATSVSLPLGWLPPTDAPQPVDPAVPNDQLIRMTNVGTHALKAVYRNGLLYFVTHDAIGSLTAVRYVRLLVNTYPVIFLDDIHKFLSRTFGVYDASDGLVAWAAWPGIEVNKAGNAAIVFSRSSQVIHAGARFTTHFAAESDIRLSHFLKEGEAIYHDGGANIDEDGNIVSMPWGDTGGASVDPKDDTAIWMAQQYATNNAKLPNYAIWVGKVFGFVYFDLVFQNVRVDSVDFSTRQLTVSGQVHNGGDGAAPDSEIAFYLDAERKTVAGLGSIAQPALDPGATADFTATLPLPPIRPASYHVRAVITTKTPKGEYSLANNVAVVPLPIR